MLNEYLATAIVTCFLALWLALSLAYIWAAQKGVLRSKVQALETPLMHGAEKPAWVGGKTVSLVFVGIVCLLVALRLALSALGLELTVDTNCFRAWAYAAAAKGVSGLYASDMFVDYPPGYLFILKQLGIFAMSLKLEMGSRSVTLLLAAVPTLVHLFLCLFVARQLMQVRLSCLGAGWPEARAFGITVFLVLFLMPHDVANSNLFGQVDSVNTALAVLAMSHLGGLNRQALHDKQEQNLSVIFAAVLFGLGVLVKPQVLLFAPIGLVFAVALHHLGAVLVAFLAFVGTVLTVYALAANFSSDLFLKLFGIYQNQLVSYPYATLNAANLYALLGLNWVEASRKLIGPVSIDLFGKLLLCCTVLFSMVCAHKDLRKIKSMHQSAFEEVSFALRTQESLFFFSGLIVTLIFTFVDEMHERYLFSAATCFVLAVLVRPSRTNLFAAVTTVALSAFNHSFFLDFHKVTNGYHVASSAPWLLVLSGFQIFTATTLLCLTIRRVRKCSGHAWVNTSACFSLSKIFSVPWKIEQKTAHANFVSFPEFQPSNSRQAAHEAKFLLVVTILAALLSFLNLGSRVSPETFWRPRTTDGDTRIYRLGHPVQESKVTAYFGLGKGKYRLSISSDQFHWVDIGVLGHEHVFEPFSWKNIDLDAASFPLPYRYVQIKNERKEGDATALFEIAVIDVLKNEVVPIAREDALIGGSKDEVIDEQMKVPLHPDFRNEMIFDEVYHVRSAYEEILGERITETSHPPFGKSLISVGISVLGLNPFGWRFVGALVGVLSVPLLYCVARVLFGTFFAASFACILFLFDFMRFTQTRLATLDGIAMFTLLASFLFTVVYGRLLLGQFVRSSPLRRRGSLVLAGIFFGLGIATKWSVLYFAPVLAVLFFFFGLLHVLQADGRCAIAPISSDLLQVNGNNKPQLDAQNNQVQARLKALLGWVTADWPVALLSFCILPAALYFLAFQLSHHRTGEPAGFADFWARQVSMYRYHSELVATHPFSSKWFEWPIIKRPLWVYSGGNVLNDTGHETTRSIVSLGNPLIWWAAIPVFVYGFWAMLRRFEVSLFIVMVTILGLYLPWVVAPRKLTFIYHFFPIVPFAILLLVWFAASFAGLVRSGSAFSGWKSSVAVIYAALCGLLFLLFFPVLSGLEVYDHFIVQYLRWFDSWVF